MTDFKSLVEQKLKEKYPEDPHLDQALSLAFEIFEWSEEGQEAIKQGLKNKANEIAESIEEELSELMASLEEV